MKTFRTIPFLVVFLCSYLLPCICSSSHALVAFEDRALDGANIIWNMDSNIGITHEELVAACRFIEKVQHAGKNTKRVFSRKTTNLPCVIERVSSPEGFIIKGLPGGHQTIGQGCHKVVNKAIFYGKRPIIIADCLSDKSGAYEISVLKKLRKCHGIVPYVGSVTRSKNQYSIFLEYCPGGTLKAKVKQGLLISTDQKIQIAKDCAMGLKSMHARHLVHRDLHSDNILLRSTPSGLFEAVLIDFGKTIDVRRAVDSDVPQAAKAKNPPEALLTPYSKLNRYRVDVYAMGCNFYFMQWRRSVPWGHVYNVYAMHTYSPSLRKKMHTRIVARYTNDKQKKIGSLLLKKQRGEALSADEEFQILIFQMLDCKPSRRPTMAEVVQHLQRLAP